MQRRQRRRFAAPPPDRHQRLALVQHILLDLVQAGHRQLPRLFVCAIMGHQKELLSALQRSFERIVLLFCSFGNPPSYFVGVNGLHPRPYAGDDVGGDGGGDGGGNCGSRSSSYNSSCAASLSCARSILGSAWAMRWRRRSTIPWRM